MSTARLTAQVERWPIDGDFTISRGSRTEAVVVVAEARRGGHTGRGECVPYARYGENVESVLALIESLPSVDGRAELAARLPPGAARNAIDCALWDLEAKQSGQRAWTLAGLDYAPPLTCFTLSLNAPDVMAARARAAQHHPLLKIKLGGGALDAERMRAVRAVRPDARLVADANEAWQPHELDHLLHVAAELNFELVEQPLPADHDAPLASLVRPLPVCADESAHTAEGLAALRARYDAVNIKLDKTGGLTAALSMSAEARRLGLRIMVGCMVGTSLAMAPATLLAQDATWVDLDGPLLLARDRAHGLTYAQGRVLAPPAELWG